MKIFGIQYTQAKITHARTVARTLAGIVPSMMAMERAAKNGTMLESNLLISPEMIMVNKSGIYVVIFTAIIFIGMVAVAAICIPTEDVTPEVPAFPVLPVLREINITPESVEVVYEPELDPVDLLLKQIIEEDVGNKGHYSMVGTSKDVDICGNKACEQAEWIADNYGYDVGIVILWSKYQGSSHAQTWVVIDNERYIFESTDDDYWTEEEHQNEFGEQYKICFHTVKKGLEHTKAAAEYYRTG